ncbi:MAG: DNA starvation/stationary phase protection protein [Chloroflexi bacterium]|nr:DNA starvation/stationary phase protection protein [Chloroflexota bacterium]
MVPNIGISDENRAAVVAMLNRRLADTFTLYTKTRKYHWNVTGMHFAELHEFFEEQYTQLDESMDQIAERVRQLGSFAIGTLDEFREQTTINEAPGTVPGDKDMIRNLINDHEALIRRFREDAELAMESYKDSGTNDFLIGLMEMHEKMAWMLRAHLEG